MSFLGHYQSDPEARSISLPLICAYIDRQLELSELVRWTISVRGLQTYQRKLGEANLGLDRRINQMSRTRLSGDPDSLGVVTNPGDETIGLTTGEIEKVRTLAQSEQIAENPAARRVRNVEEGLLLIYPISRYSGHDLEPGGSRRPLYEDPSDSDARDIIALAISFPHSERAQRIIGEYVVGTVGWRAV